MAAESEEKLIGHITHYFSQLGVGIIELTDAGLSVGDVIHVKGHHTTLDRPWNLCRSNIKT